MKEDEQDSAAVTRAFFSRLGVEGLERRTSTEWDSLIVTQLIEMLPSKARVLDVGCGYGRISLPLVHGGFDVTGLDISPNFIEVARERAALEHARIEFFVGSMTKLPFDEESFDIAVCLWTAFNDLFREEEQRQALQEMLRVLRPQGFALLEGPLYREATDEEIRSGARSGPEHRIVRDEIEGIPKLHYAHDERSFRRLCDAVGIARFDVFERSWGGRERLFLRFEK